jgi:hypothetical protein
VRGCGLLLLGTLAALPVATHPARAADEIQLYNAEIAELGQWTIQHHFNYAFSGRKEPDFPGGLVPNHALNATPEFAYGLTDWFELGWYVPWAIDENGRFLSNAFKFRTLFVTPNANKRDFFYGLNFEFDATTPPFSETRFAMEIRPIIGWRNPQWEFIVNPIFDLGFGTPGDVDFLPAARLARTFSEDFALALEYYTDLGRPGAFPSFNEQSHQIYGVVDFKIGPVDVDFGLGYGLTPGSDRFMAKTILTYAIPVAGKSQDEKPSMKTPMTMKSSARQTSATQFAGDPFAGTR